MKRQLKEFAVSERKVSDHRDLVSRWLLALRAGERLYLHKLKFYNCHECITFFVYLWYEWVEYPVVVGEYVVPQIGVVLAHLAKRN